MLVPTGMLMQSGTGGVLTSVLVQERSVEADGDPDWSAIVSEACWALRGLCIHDDLRKDMSCAYDNGKYFLGAEATNGAGDTVKVFKVLINLAKIFKERPLLAAAALSASKQLITSEEAVKVAAQHGAMELPLRILSWPDASVSLLRSIAGLMRNMCGDDLRKNKLVSDGSLALLVAALSSEKCLGCGVFCEHALACLAAMSLRSPTNSTRIASTGALEVMANVMRRHADKGALQRQGCLAVRNMSARCPDLHAPLLDVGMEAILRAAGRLQDSVDEAYGTLKS
jgi:armadillo repeat-containing protein 6